MSLEESYRSGRQEALQKCLDAVWELCQPNGSGAYSEGQFDACEEVAKAIQEFQKHDLPESWNS